MNKVSVDRTLYKLYYAIRARCYHASSHNFPYYQGKGIKLCDEWIKDKKSFYAWALKSGWKKGLSIDRIDSSRDYCPENCRFISLSENSVKARLETPSINRSSKLSCHDVISIKKDLSLGVSGVMLAKKFNIHKSYIYKIKHNKRWNHIEIPN